MSHRNLGEGVVRIRRRDRRLKKGNRGEENLQPHRPKKETERAEGDDKDEDEDYIPSEEPSSEDPSYEPTKKELKRADREGDQ